jgi:simple sugar transport system permease protein
MTTILSVNPQKVEHEGFAALRSIKIEINALGYTAKNGNFVPARMELGVVVALICVAVIFILLKYVRLGRNFYAIGGNQTSALMLGINVKRTRFMSYIISGLLSGISGYVFMMHTGAGNATNAAGMEMNAIASSIIGGTLLTGGVGNVLGTLFGTMTLTTIKKIVVSSGLNDPWWQSITTGGMLCFFILLQSVVLNKRNKSKK